MSEELKHKCGIALVRLLKPLDYYQEKYGTWRYGLQKLYLLMEKQRNRGQDGAGIVSLKLDVQPGYKYFNRERSVSSSAINKIFERLYKRFSKIEKKHPELLNDPAWVKQNIQFAAELYLGHLRYGTFGNNSLDNVHPVMRQNNWKSRNLVLAGNFNLTNVDELFNLLIDLGQAPKDYSDTVTILEKVGHFLDVENQNLFSKYKTLGYANTDISNMIAKNIDVAKVLTEASKNWDGGYVIAGLVGHGDAFVLRDPWGIRPAFHYHDDEIAVVASERPVIQTALNITYDKIEEVPPGHAVVIKKTGLLRWIKFWNQGKENPARLKEYIFRGVPTRIFIMKGKDWENLSFRMCWIL